MRPSRGFTIVELLVALTIGAILLGGAVTLFINNRANYQVSTDLARLQENGRFALNLISEDLRMAGHAGCVNDLSRITLSADLPAGAGDLWQMRTALEGVEGSAASPAWKPSGRSVTVSELGLSSDIGSGAPGPTGSYKILGGTDAVTIRYFLGDLSDAGPDTANPDGIPDWRVTDATATTLTVDYANPESTQGRALGAGLVGAVSDCAGADVFLIDSVSGQIITASNDLSRSYGSATNPHFGLLRAVRYYVGINGSGEPALFRATIGAGPSEVVEELFEGVESMQILYGVDTRDSSGALRPDGVPDDYVDADNVGDENAWNHVVSVRIGLLLRTQPFGQSGTNLGGPGGSIMVNGTSVPIDPDDQRRRRVFQTTVLVRNLQ